MAVSEGARDLCLHCGKVICFGNWRFYKDTGEPVVQPRNADDAWWAEYKRRGSDAKTKGWWHIVPPMDHADKVYKKCDPSKEGWRPVADPTNWCNEDLNEGGMCNRPVKETIQDGNVKRPMCGLHLAHFRKAEREAEERNNAYAIEAWLRSETEKKIERLKAFGVDAEEHWVRHYSGPMTGSYTGKVVVDPDTLLEILDEKMETF